MSGVARQVAPFVRRQRRTFDSLASVPLASYRLVAAWDRYGDLSRRSDRKRYPDADDVAIVTVEERFRIRGVDRDQSLEDLFLTFIKVGGRWLVANDSDVAGIGFRSARHLWDFGSLHLERGNRFVALGHDCGNTGAFCGTRAQQILAAAERALDEVNTYWRGAAGLKVGIFVPSTPEELRRLIQATFDVEEFVAFAYFTLDPNDDYRFTGNRMIFNFASLASRSSADIYRILVHELTHIATRAHAGLFVPVFVDEGIAEYVSQANDPSRVALLESQVAAGGFDGRLPKDYEFLTGSSASIYQSYQESHSAVRYFVERWGFDDFVRFYRTLGRRTIAPGTTEYHLNRALRTSIGIGFRAFEQAWADSIG
ncbi:MAG TPA: hypothetical protein VHJ82_06595 [Actinomycetota bacterium]|nr:hypothetical protein [Actinomycetota bacterium]